MPSVNPLRYNGPVMTDSTPKALACGCQVQTYRDFLGRVVGTILARDGQCPHAEHTAGKTVVMPGRENARQE
jgi:hypothetical protein